MCCSKRCNLYPLLLQEYVVNKLRKAIDQLSVVGRQILGGRLRDEVFHAYLKSFVDGKGFWVQAVTEWRAGTSALAHRSRCCAGGSTADGLCAGVLGRAPSRCWYTFRPRSIMRCLLPGALGLGQLHQMGRAVQQGSPRQHPVDTPPQPPALIPPLLCLHNDPVSSPLCIPMSCTVQEKNKLMSEKVELENQLVRATAGGGVQHQEWRCSDTG